MAVSNKTKQCHCAFKRGSKTGLGIDAPDMSLIKIFLKFFVYIMFVNSLFELVLSRYCCKYQL